MTVGLRIHFIRNFQNKIDSVCYWLQSSEVVRFEMDSDSLSSVLTSLKDVEEQIQKHVKQN